MRKFTFIAAILMATVSFMANAQWYIRGAFNDYTPNDQSEWALTASADNAKVFVGSFNIPAGQFDFNFVNPDGNIFVPFNASTFDLHNQVVVFTDNVYSGNCSLAWDDYDEVYMWKYPEWEGGKIEVKIYANSNNPKIEFTLLSDESTGISKINPGNEPKAVYNLKGVKVLDNDNDLNGLTPGIYIINGKKVVVC